MMAKRVFGVPHHVASIVMATVSLTAWLGLVVCAAPATATEPSAAAAPASGEDSGCLRPLPDVIWGFLVTLFACAVPVWGTEKYIFSERDKVSFLFVAVFSPVYGLWAFTDQSLQSAVLIWRYNKLCRTLSQRLPFRDWYDYLKMFWSWVSPLSKSQGRILFCCHIVVYVVKESPLLQEEWLWAVENKYVEDLSEAMVIGEVAEGKTQNGHYERKGLSYKGIAALMLAEVVPKYDQLKFLRGNSGFAMIALAMQAFGYIYAVVFRVVNDLLVTPLEVVGFILNILLLMDFEIFSFFNPCHRPLVIYINSWREEKVLEKMVHVKEQYSVTNWISKWSYIMVGVICVGLGGIIVYFIVSLFKVSSILVVVPLIIFLVANIIFIIGIPNYECDKQTMWFGILLSIVAYTWAFVVTIVYWDTKHFNARAKLLNVSQLIPFIG